MKVLVILTFLVFLLFVNKFIGESLGIIGKCKLTNDAAHRVRYYSDCTGFTEYFINKILGASAVTFDHVILTPYIWLSESTYSHELAHTKQYELLGPAFLPLYGLAQIIAVVDAKIEGYSNPHAGNFFEIWANKTAGLKPEEKIWK